MATITLKGNKCRTSGTLPKVGTKAPAFKLTNNKLQEVTLKDYSGKMKILNIVPSLDTGICDMSARRFEKEVAKLAKTVVLNISRDTPFAAGRFCDKRKIKKVVTLSEFTNRDFGAKYGVAIVNGPMNGALARAIVVLDENDKVLYTELVPEIAQEPDYAAAIAAVKGAGKAAPAKKKKAAAKTKKAAAKKKPAAKKPAAKKPAAKKTAAKKSTAKTKTVAKKAAAKKKTTAGKKATAKKTVSAKSSTGKKSAAKKKTARRKK